MKGGEACCFDSHTRQKSVVLDGTRGLTISATGNGVYVCYSINESSPCCVLEVVWLSPET